MKIKNIIVLAVIFVQIVLASYIASKETSGGQVCSINNKDTCGAVVNSSFGSIFGIKVSVLGIIAFSILFVVGLFAIGTKVFSGMMILGALIAVYLLIVQMFFLKEFCLFCTITDVLMVLNLIFYILVWN